MTNLPIVSNVLSGYENSRCTAASLQWLEGYLFGAQPPQVTDEEYVNIYLSARRTRTLRIDTVELLIYDLPIWNLGTIRQFWAECRDADDARDVIRVCEGLTIRSMITLLQIDDSSRTLEVMKHYDDTVPSYVHGDPMALLTNELMALRIDSEYVQASTTSGKTLLDMMRELYTVRRVALQMAQMILVHYPQHRKTSDLFCRDVVQLYGERFDGRALGDLWTAPDYTVEVFHTILLFIYHKMKRLRKGLEEKSLWQVPDPMDLTESVIGR